MTIDFYAINKKVIAFFARYHMITFILLACTLLAVAIYLLFAIIESTTTAPKDANSTITGFDQKTIDKIKNLRDSSNASELQLPSGRKNPFSE